MKYSIYLSRKILLGIIVLLTISTFYNYKKYQQIRTDFTTNTCNKYHAIYDLVQEIESSCDLNDKQKWIQKDQLFNVFVADTETAIELDLVNTNMDSFRKVKEQLWKKFQYKIIVPTPKYKKLWKHIKDGNFNYIYQRFSQFLISF